MREKRKQNAFTLVELLVVIAIISVLAALLLPVLEKSIDSALTVDCHNRLRQLGLATAYYIEDSNDVIPIGLYDLAPYTNDDIAAHITNVYPPRTNNPAMCQAFVNYTEYNGTNSSVAPFQDYHRCDYWHFTTYKQNNFFMLGYEGQSNPWAYPPYRGYRTPYRRIRMTDIKQPTKTINYIEWSNNAQVWCWGSARFSHRHEHHALSVQLGGNTFAWPQAYKLAYTVKIIPWANAGVINNPAPGDEAWQAWAAYLWWKP